VRQERKEGRKKAKRKNKNKIINKDRTTKNRRNYYKNDQRNKENK
jgi:hypothetical protein